MNARVPTLFSDYEFMRADREKGEATNDHRILLLDLYAKNQAENLSQAQLKELPPPRDRFMPHGCPDL